MPDRSRLSRRTILKAALGGIALGASLPGSAATPSQTEGPFFPKHPQPDTDFDMTRIDGHQGVAVLRNRVLSVVPYTAGVVTFDTKRRVWENRVTLDAGVKVVRPFVGGVVEAGVAERRQYTVLTDEVQTAPVVYVNLWVGWNPRTVSRR